MWNRIWFSFSMLLLINIPVYGQKDSTIFEPSIHIGAQYGMSWNDINFSPVVDQGIFNGQRIALVMRYVSDPHLGIQLEAAYDTRGWTETNDTIVSDYTREINYLELAFFTHISIGNRRIRPVILLGSFLSYPIQETETFPSEWSTIPYQPFYYGKKLPERLQFGLAGGLGFEFVFDRFSLQFDGRYRSSLGGIFSVKQNDDEINFTFSNSQGFMTQVTGVFKF